MPSASLCSANPAQSCRTPRTCGPALLLLILATQSSIINHQSSIINHQSCSLARSLALSLAPSSPHGRCIESFDECVEQLLTLTKQSFDQQEGIKTTYWSIFPALLSTPPPVHALANAYARIEPGRVNRGTAGYVLGMLLGTGVIRWSAAVRRGGTVLCTGYWTTARYWSAVLECST